MPAVARQNERHCNRPEPHPGPAPTSLTLEARSLPEVVEALRVWRDERGITHEVFDAIAGWADGYAGKLLAPIPIKNLGWLSLGDARKALAIKLVVVEDPEQRKLVERRWKQRERPNQVPAQTASAPGPTRRHHRVTSRR